MQTGGDLMSSEMEVHKFWFRRIAGPHYEDETTADVLTENHLLFPPAQVEIADETHLKSRPSSPFGFPESSDINLKEDIGVNQLAESSSEGQPYFTTSKETLDGSSLGDIPCRYRVTKAESHEMTAVGVYMDPRIISGFRYKIRILTKSEKKRWLFGGIARELESIGRGFSRRVTLKPIPGQLCSNPDYFWTDSVLQGYAFSLQVISPGDRFTLFDADHQPVGHLEVTQIQGPQYELSQKVLQDGQVEKSVLVKALCNVEWFHEKEMNSVIPLKGICLSVRPGRGRAAVVKDVRDVKLGIGQNCRVSYTLVPGTCSTLRSLRVFGRQISDVPTSYTILGIEPYHQPAIGTYLDKRISAGFHYRVQLGGCGKSLFGGRALRLDSIGRGYAKRITFNSERPNQVENHFWSDSHPEGFGFEVSAVRTGMKFVIKTKDSGHTIGHALVFRDDAAPQIELHHSTVEEENGKGVLKKVQIDVKCIVNFDLPSREELEPHVMRVSGIATLHKLSNQTEAKLLQIEDIGLDSQLNILFFNQWQLIFYPI